MSIAKITEISAASPKSFEDAIREGVKRASKTIKHLKSVWVKEQEAVIGDNGELTEFRVIMKVTFVVED